MFMVNVSTKCSSDDRVDDSYSPFPVPENGGLNTSQFGRTSHPKNFLIVIHTYSVYSLVYDHVKLSPAAASITDGGIS